jgi:hypothetical protein
LASDGKEDFESGAMAGGDGSSPRAPWNRKWEWKNRRRKKEARGDEEGR